MNACGYTIDTLKQRFDEAVEKGVLTDREKTIISMRYGFDGKGLKPLEEVGKQFKVTRERIRQIEARALKKIRSLDPRKERIQKRFDEAVEKGLLTEVEKRLLPMRFCLSDERFKTRQEAGDILGISREQARAAEESGFMKLMSLDPVTKEIEQ